MNIEDLNKQIRQCHKCRLSETRKNAICGEGGISVIFGYNDEDPICFFPKNSNGAPSGCPLGYLAGM